MSTDDDAIIMATWDRPVRVFHWINALLILSLGAVGTVIFFGEPLGITNEGKITLKTIHVSLGYVFVTNLVIRFIWAFLGNENARWRSIFPWGQGFTGALKEQLRNFMKPAGHQYPGHSPLGRMSIFLMLVCMTAMACTGLVLAGTDLFFPPFGSWVAGSVVATGVDPASLVPYQPELVNEQAWETMRAWRSPFKEIHELGYFALLFLVPLHIAGVFFAELRGGGGIVSAMINGRK
jgi:cytochrome b